jgi:hypothetical protein
VINLDSRPDRLRAATEELRLAGFRDIRRFPAVDAAAPGVLDDAWGHVGRPRFAPWDHWFRARPGAQGCFLSHIGVWEEIIHRNLPFACVFEDDIFFHRHWKTLAPTSFDFTPMDYDLLFMGSRIDAVGPGLVRQIPAYCTHAYLITGEGADRMRRVMLEDPEGVGTLDIKIVRYQKLKVEGWGTCPFTWYVWSGITFPEQRAPYDPTWRLRNSGLVFQDYATGSDTSG